MKKNLLLLFSCIAISTATFGQQKTTTNKKQAIENIYTSLKPADGQGAVFNVNSGQRAPTFPHETAPSF